MRTLIHPARCNRIDSALLYSTQVLCVTTSNLSGGRVYYKDTQEHITHADLRNTGEILCQQLVF